MPDPNLQQIDPVNTAKPALAPWRSLVMPGVVAGLLGGQMIFIAIAITLATGDRSFAVVPDYYQKAVDWDQRKADLAASQAMGWRVELRPSPQADELGRRQLVLIVQDRAGLPVRDASVNVQMFHHARAKDHQAAGLSEVLPGQYAALVEMPRPGRWQFDVEVKRGDERYVTTMQQHVSDQPGGE